jgi:hypothetical protein
MIMGWAIAVVAALFSLTAGICYVEAGRAARRSAYRVARRGRTQRPIAARTADRRRQTEVEDETIAVTDLATLRAVVSGQRKEIGYLHRRVQDTEWRLRSARERIKLLTDASSQGDAAALARRSASGEASPAPSEQFRRLRALVLKEIHPDHATADGIDRDIRTALFKRMWPQIEALSERV